MEKFNSKKHQDHLKGLPFSYLSLPLYLDFCAYTFPRNEENLLIWQDAYYPHEFPSIFLPKNPKNWQRASMTMVTADDIKKIEAANIDIAIKVPTESEFFYQTKEFTHPKAKLKERITQFQNSYKFTIKETYKKDKIAAFYEQWAEQKENKTDLFQKESTELFHFCLDNLHKYEIRQIYIEIRHKLVGLAWGIAHSEKNWVGLHLKADYQYKGLSRYLHYLRAQLFPEYERLSLGTGCHDEGLIQFKKELGPVEERQYYYIFTKDLRPTEKSGLGRNKEEKIDKPSK
jgi:hypothetical protein